ncbi:MAG: hypothetical protein KatS3mg002_0614 [Candidatus Woesearchaeota archaeon]|nr:MAG: hypothetical protein KatS3mg002_0614 [Candidatus Woesearchaeota archaeon]
MRKITSEANFLWKILIKIMLTPLIFILFLFGKKSSKELFQPILLLFEFITEAKLTISLITINIIIYFTAFLFQKSLFLQYPSDLFSNRVYTIITAGFMHANILHLINNMVALFIFGRVVERELGYKKTLAIYFLSLILSGIFFSIFNMKNNIPGLGASGAIMGLIATAILLKPFYITFELIIPLPIMIIGWIMLYTDITGILYSSNDGIGHIAHIAGFLSISLIMFVLEKKDREKIKKGFFINVVSAIIFVLAYLFLI